MKIRSKHGAALRTRRGGALVLSLLAVVTVVVLSASFSQFTSAVANRQAQAVHRKRAFYMAEAGLTEAFSGLSCGKSGNVGSEEKPAAFGDGLFWVEATEIEPDVIRLESTGMVGTGSVELALVAERGTKSVASLGVFSSGLVRLNAGSLADAYDSSLGSYASQTDKSGAVLGSNAAIQLVGTALKPTTVKGDVTPGKQFSVQSLGTVKVTGASTPALAETTELPEVEVPELALGPAQVHASPYPLVIPAGSTGFQSLTVQGGSQVILQGPAKVVIGSLTLAASAELAFDTTQGAVELYVTDALELATGSLVTTSSKKPERVTIQVGGEMAQAAHLRSTGAFYGVVYSPESPVVLGSSFELFGALATKGLTLEGSAKLHFDKHLAALAVDSTLPVMLSWRLVELASYSTDLSSDPFDELGVDKNVLPAPAGAHADQDLAIDYYDASNVYHRYVGPESAFDWNVVKTVISATRDGRDVLFPRAPAVKTGTKKSPGVAPVIDGPMI